jgi:hypothetical protein
MRKLFVFLFNTIPADISITSSLLTLPPPKSILAWPIAKAFTNLILPFLLAFISKLYNGFLNKL